MAFLAQYQQFLDEAVVQDEMPDWIDQTYQFESCLKYRDDKQVYLVSDRRNGVSAILRVMTTIDARDNRPKRDQEYAILSTLDFPGIPKVFGSFVDDERSFMVREYFPGRPLDALLTQQGSLDISGTIEITLQLCTILEYLHSRTPPVIHRDIKPGNIIIMSNGRIGLTDFGIARIYHADTTTDTVYDGTILYAPPEQFGFAQTTPLSDIYALGIVMLCMMTGSPVRQGIDERISDRQIKAIIERCIAFDPSDRFQSVAELREKLTAYSKAPARILNTKLRNMGRKPQGNQAAEEARGTQAPWGRGRRRTQDAQASGGQATRFDTTSHPGSVPTEAPFESRVNADRISGTAGYRAVGYTPDGSSATGYSPELASAPASVDSRISTEASARPRAPWARMLKVLLALALLAGAGSGVYYLTTVLSTKNNAGNTVQPVSAWDDPDRPKADPSLNPHRLGTPGRPTCSQVYRVGNPMFPSETFGNLGGNMVLGGIAVESPDAFYVAVENQIICLSRNGEPVGTVAEVEGLRSLSFHQGRLYFASDHGIFCYQPGAGDIVLLTEARAAGIYFRTGRCYFENLDDNRFLYELEISAIDESLFEGKADGSGKLVDGGEDMYAAQVIDPPDSQFVVASLEQPGEQPGGQPDEQSANQPDNQSDATPIIPGAIPDVVPHVPPNAHLSSWLVSTCNGNYRNLYVSYQAYTDSAEPSNIFFSMIDGNGSTLRIRISSDIHASWLSLLEKHIYFYDSEANALVGCDITSSSEINYTVLANGACSHIVAAPYGVFYITPVTGQLSVIRFNDRAQQTVLPSGVETYAVTGDWVFYTTRQDTAKTTSQETAQGTPADTADADIPAAATQAAVPQAAAPQAAWQVRMVHLDGSDDHLVPQPAMPPDAP